MACMSEACLTGVQRRGVITWIVHAGGAVLIMTGVVMSSLKPQAKPQADPGAASSCSAGHQAMNVNAASRAESRATESPTKGPAAPEAPVAEPVPLRPAEEPSGQAGVQLQPQTHGSSAEDACERGLAGLHEKAAQKQHLSMP